MYTIYIHCLIIYRGSISVTFSQVFLFERAKNAISALHIPKLASRNSQNHTRLSPRISSSSSRTRETWEKVTNTPAQLSHAPLYSHTDTQSSPHLSSSWLIPIGVKFSSDSARCCWPRVRRMRKKVDKRSRASPSASLELVISKDDD